MTNGQVFEKIVMFALDMFDQSNNPQARENAVAIRRTLTDAYTKHGNNPTDWPHDAIVDAETLIRHFGMALVEIDDMVRAAHALHHMTDEPATEHTLTDEELERMMKGVSDTKH
jgi:V8-like Glu-specific endopeptidase